MYVYYFPIIFPQVLLIRQQTPQESEHPVRSGGNGVYVLIWERALSSLTKHVLSSAVFDGSSSTSDDDLNVEHAQLLLFLFHSLALMQKKQVTLLRESSV